MKYILLFLCFASVKSAISQDVYPLHPSVGDTISEQEKLDYSLFPGIDNVGFEYAHIQFLNESFVIIVSRKHKEIETEDDPLVLHTFYIINDSIPLKQEQIIEEQKKIQKVNAYYQYLAEEASRPKEEPPKAELKPQPMRFEGPMVEQIKKEARMKVRIETQKRMEREFQMGLRPRQMFIQFD